MQTAEIETITSHAADFQTAALLNQRSSADHRRQLSRARQRLAGARGATGRGLARDDEPDREPGPLPLPLAAGGGPRAQRPTAIIVHGLEGSSDSQYVVGNSNKLWRAGCNIVRMNMRNCGGTEALSSTLYHSGLSNDVLVVMNFFVAQYGLRSMSLIGYSMGGNLVLKLAGELGTTAPAVLRSVIGVSPAVDLDASADALHLPVNRLYELKFLHNLLNRFRRKAMLFPRAYDRNRATGIRSLREFDDRITALYSGFTSAQDYYDRAAAARVVDRIAVPTLVLHALDDPFVRLTSESRDKLNANPKITLLESPRGGHCAFLAQPDEANGYDGYWAEHTLLRFLLANA